MVSFDGSYGSHEQQEFSHKNDGLVFTVLIMQEAPNSLDRVPLILVGVVVRETKQIAKYY